MTQTSFLFSLLGGLTVLALAFLVLTWRHRHRNRFLREAGRRAGLTPLGAGETLHFAPVPLLRRKGRGIGAALRGTWQGRPILLFDLFHPMGRSMVMQTVLAVEISEMRLPEFAILAHDPKLYAPTLDMRPVEPAPPELAHRWHLYSRNGNWPFTPQLTGWLAARSGGWSFEGTGQVLYLYHRGATANTRRLRPWIDGGVAEALEFAQRASAYSDHEPPAM